TGTSQGGRQRASSWSRGGAARPSPTSARVLGRAAGCFPAAVDDPAPRCRGPSMTLVRFGTPRKLPRAESLEGRVVVLDIAFAGTAGGGFDKVTKKLIDGLGARLVGWIDHHDHERHKDYAQDPRFVLARKSEHGACPEMVTPALVERLGPAETLLCHTDFDGLASAAKWLCHGHEPYPGCDDDARAIDTRLGTPSPE